jgi:cation transport ATPase-like protein
VNGYGKVDEIPFDFERRRVSVVVDGPDGRRLLVTKGAPEQLLPLVIALERNGQITPLTDDDRNACMSFLRIFRRRWIAGSYFGFLVAATLSYLALVEIVKRRVVRYRGAGSASVRA